MRRWALAPLSLAAALAIGTEAPHVLIAQVPKGAEIELSDRGSAFRDRIDVAARAAIASYTEWLGPPPFTQLRIGDVGAPDVRIRLPLLASPGAMALESQVATGIARAWFGKVPGPGSWREDAAWYLQSRIVEQLFNRAFMKEGYRFDTTCFFGCRVRWAFRSLPLSRWAVMSPFRADGAFASLERELGWPTLQGALRAAVSAGTDPVVAMSDATGRDLAPVFQAVASGDPSSGWMLIDASANDHAIGELTSISGTCATPCYRSEVAIRRRGLVPFPLSVRISFADGQTIETRWDGRRDRLAFESAAPAVAARLDPDRVWLRDPNPLNNANVQPSATNVPITKWMARWVLWLQDAMLTHTFPV